MRSVCAAQSSTCADILPAHFLSNVVVSHLIFPNTSCSSPATYTGTSNAHADSAGTQLETLQTVFRRLQSGEIGKVEGDWKFQVGSGGNKIVTAKQWKERLPKSFLWIDFCCIPQMSIPLTAELLGFDSSEGGENEGGNNSSWLASSGDGDLGCGGGGGGSLVVVKAAVLHELAQRSKSARLPGQCARMSGIGGSFKTSFRDVKRMSVKKDKGDAPVLKEGDSGVTSTTATNAALTTTTDDDNDATTDHRHLSAGTEGWKKVNKIMLGKAVQSIPAYIERSSLIVALVPPCKHADRKDEICDESSWRGRGWCRVEYLGAALVRSDVSVMVVKDAHTTPEFVFPVDGLQLPPGHGTYTCCSRKCTAHILAS